MDRAKALEAKNIYENYQAFIGSPIGVKLTEKMASIETAAIERSMRGPTPDDTNGYFENRGKVTTIYQLNQLFADVVKENEDAVKWLQANPPQENASQETA